jgi:hypothetical protein
MHANNYFASCFARASAQEVRLAALGLGPGKVASQMMLKFLRSVYLFGRLWLGAS